MLRRLQTGVPANPGAWLMAVAKRRAIDTLRRDKTRERKHEEIARTLDETMRPRRATTLSSLASVETRSERGAERIGALERL